MNTDYQSLEFFEKKKLALTGYTRINDLMNQNPNLDPADELYRICSDPQH